MAFSFYTVTAEVNMDASHIEKIVVRAKSERKAVEEAKKLFKKAGFDIFWIISVKPL